VAGDSTFCWAKRYLTGEFGEVLTEKVPMPGWEGEGPAPLIDMRIENPDWDPSREYVARSDRPDEWTKVALIGQVYVRLDASVAAGDKVRPATGGVGTKSTDKTGLRCMSITTPYDAGKGYAIGRCILNVVV